MDDDWLGNAGEVIDPAPFPVSEDVLAAAERVMGHGFSPDVRAAYLHLGLQFRALDGTVRTLMHPMAAAEKYSRQVGHDYRLWQWPNAVVPIVDRGCGILACVAALAPNSTVWWFDPNLSSEADPELGYVPPWDTGLLFRDWLLRYSKGDIFQDLYLNR